MERRLPQANIPFDIIACDRNGKTSLLVEVKARHLESSQHRDWFIEKVKLHLHSSNTEISFAILVDIEDIQIFRCNSSDWLEPVSNIKTTTVLSHYESKYGKIRIYYHYLEGLVEAWLRDLAYRWKSDNPPASKELEKIGLLQQLEGGTTYSGVELNNESLY